MLLEILVGICCGASGALLVLVSIFTFLKNCDFSEEVEELETIMFVVLSLLIISVVLIVFIILLS